MKVGDTCPVLVANMEVSLFKASQDTGQRWTMAHLRSVLTWMSRRRGAWAFQPEVQTCAQHANEAERNRKHPPSDAFGSQHPQNIQPRGADGLSADPCHRDSDRVDLDGLPKIGAAVWPGQTYSRMVCYACFFICVKLDALTETTCGNALSFDVHPSCCDWDCNEHMAL